LLSLAHPLFFGVGAYTSALLTMNFNYNFIIASLCAGIFAVIISIITGYISLRATYHAFGLITLAITFIAYYIAYNLPFVGGSDGIVGVPSPRIGSVIFRSASAEYYIGLVIVVITLISINFVLTSRVGRAFHAICDDDLLSRSFGLNPTAYRLLGFAISALFAGIAGSYYAHIMNFIGPDAFGFPWTMNLLIMVLVGGSRSFIGVIIGAALLSILPDLLRMTNELRLLLFGVILLFLIIYMPKGIGGIVSLKKPKGRKESTIVNLP